MAKRQVPVTTSVCLIFGTGTAQFAWFIFFFGSCFLWLALITGGDKPNWRTLVAAGILPAFGLIFILERAVRIWRLFRLLTCGTLTRGNMSDKKENIRYVKGKRYSEFIFKFRFKDQDGVVHEHTEHSGSQEGLSDDFWERMLYLQQDPSQAVMLDLFNFPITFNQHDRIEETPLRYALAYLILPAITAAGYLLILA